MYDCRKSLRLSSFARREMTTGETINLMAIDTQKFMDVVLTRWVC